MLSEAVKELNGSDLRVLEAEIVTDPTEKCAQVKMRSFYEYTPSSILLFSRSF
jgi:hypothetical protein